MPISNPARFFVTGSNTKEFTYEPGSELFNWCPRDCGLSKTMEMNILLFANSTEHAFDIVQEMLEFTISCAKEFITYDEDYGSGNSTPSRERAIIRCRELIENRDKWVVTPVKRNQVFKTGWAYNDTI